jgi:hypothetical protein
MIDLTSLLNLQPDRNLKIALHEAESHYMKARAEVAAPDDKARVTDAYFTDVFDLYAGFLLSQQNVRGQEKFETLLEELSVSLLAILVHVLVDAHGFALTGKESHIHRVSIKLDARQAHWKARYLASVLDEHTALKMELARQSKTAGGLEDWCHMQNPRIGLTEVKYWRSKRWGPQFPPNARISDKKRDQIEQAIRSGAPKDPA